MRGFGAGGVPIKREEDASFRADAFQMDVVSISVSSTSSSTGIMAAIPRRGEGYVASSEGCGSAKMSEIADFVSCLWYTLHHRITIGWSVTMHLHSRSISLSL